MVSIIVRELYEQQVIIPTPLEVNNTFSQHVFKGMNGTLYLSIRLSMKRSTELHLCTQALLEKSQKMRSELGSPIRNDR